MVAGKLQAAGVAEAAEKLQTAGAAVAPEKLQAVGAAEAAEKLQTAGAAAAPEKLQTAGAAVAPEKLQTVGAAVIAGPLSQVFRILYKKTHLESSLLRSRGNDYQLPELLIFLRSYSKQNRYFLPKPHISDNGYIR